ncbi:MAG: hypothetical protein DRQ55_05250 [Planctomycetota bacterium]|nr:MAG: hypothetical protein DRQ55_05250 [Planctomycetota bacterium]
MTGSEPASERGWAWAWLALAALVLCAGTFGVHNLDWPLHDVTGRWILEHGEVPATNVLSQLHSDYPSVHDKWGFQVLTHLVHQAGGAEGLLLLRLALMGGLAALLLATARGLGASPAAAVVCLALALLAARGRFLIRPDLASMLLLAAFVWVVLVARPDGRRAGWLLLPLQLIWVNLHGYFVLGWLLVAVVALVWWLSGPAGRGAARRWFVLALGLSAVSLVNPAGLDGWLHPFAILSDLSQHGARYRGAIAEFLPTFASDPRGPWDRTACLVLGVVALLALAARAPRAWAQRSSGPWVLPALGLLLLFGAMLPSLRRNMAPFALVVAGPAAAALPYTLARSRALPLLALGLVLALCAGEVSDAISIHDGLQRRAGTSLSSLAYPDAGIEFIARELPEGRVFTAFSYGSRFTGRRWPEQVASTNGNTHGYPSSWFERVVAAERGESPMAFRRLVWEHGFDVALLPMDGPLAARLLREADWTLVFLGRIEAVFVASEGLDPLWLAEHELESALAAGEAPPLPAGEPRPWFGVRRPAGPAARAAALCMGGLRGEAALAYARRAVQRWPADGLAQGLLGLTLLARGDEAGGLAALRASEACGDVHQAQDAVRRALQAHAEDGAR